MDKKKNNNANISKHREAIIALGLVSAFAFSLVSLEFIGVEVKQYVPEESTKTKELAYDEDFEPPPPEVEEPEPPKEQPPEQKPEVEPPANDTKEVPKDEVIKKPVKIESGPPPPKKKKAPKKKAKVYDFPSQEAVFPGGMPKMYEFLYSKIKYPPQARQADIQGKVFVEFVIGTDGKVEEVKVLRGIGGGCDEEAIKAIKALPAWTPAEQSGKKVKQRFRLPIKFQLD